MNTRKFPRTMQEAFGPYTSHDLHEMADQASGKDLALTVLITVCALAGFGLLVFVR